MTLSEDLSTLPTAPGVYLMRGERGEVLYIGKARHLVRRVKTYFQNSEPHSPRIAKMLPLVTRVETLITNTEVEALVLEEQLIRKHQPPYNTLLKNSKGFPYIRISWAEDYPRVEMVRKKTAKDGALYYGPYPSGSAVQQLLSAIREIFPLEKCKDPRKEKQVCIYYDMRRCLGHCQKKVSSEAFKEMLMDIRLFLEGKSSELKTKLLERMQFYSERMLYEQAAQMRDTLKSLQRYIEPALDQKIVGEPQWNFDVITFARNPLLCSLQVYPIKEGEVQLPLSHTWHVHREDSDAAILSRFLYLHYSQHPIPKSILMSALPSDKPLLESWLKETTGHKVQIKVPQRGEKKALLQTLQKSTDQKLKKEALKYKYTLLEEGLSELKQLLELKEEPSRIEGFDISHFQGQETVASMVVFEHGAPSKNQYRRYKIHAAEGEPNDFLSMEEVVSRTYSSRHKKGQAFPDLILIDGGKGQVSSAIKAFHQLRLPLPPLLGLAKKEELIVLPDRKDLIRLPRHSAALRLLQQIRDEAHRFALGYQRQRRKKRILSSDLDGIKGIGPSRKRILLQQLGSIARIKEASVQDLILQGKLPQKLAEEVYKHFRR